MFILLRGWQSFQQKKLFNPRKKHGFDFFAVPGVRKNREQQSQQLFDRLWLHLAVELFQKCARIIVMRPCVNIVESSYEICTHQHDDVALAFRLIRIKNVKLNERNSSSFTFAAEVLRGNCRHKGEITEADSCRPLSIIWFGNVSHSK